jgi:hypothetical protein
MVHVRNGLSVSIFLYITYWIGTNQVNAFPWDHFQILGVEFSQLGMSPFAMLA